MDDLTCVSCAPHNRRHTHQSLNSGELGCTSPNCSAMARPRCVETMDDCVVSHPRCYPAVDAHERARVAAAVGSPWGGRAGVPPRALQVEPICQVQPGSFQMMESTHVSFHIQHPRRTPWADCLPCGSQHLHSPRFGALAPCSTVPCSQGCQEVPTWDPGTRGGAILGCRCAIPPA